MEELNLYRDIQTRTHGEIYIGVVGPVRSGKSTFIQKFMDAVVIPNIQDTAAKERAIDELPQSAAGRTIMTTEPKFVPEQAITVHMDDTTEFKVRMIDCVGYIVPSALGYIEEDQPRMVRTPWFDEPIPFNMAAELGTQKVINEHSTVGLVITTDGSISDIPRAEYQEAEARVVQELQETGRPFIVLLNCVYPNSDAAQQLAQERAAAYGVPVVPMNCTDLSEADIKTLLTKLLYQFPIRELQLEMPNWILQLEDSHWLKTQLLDCLRDAVQIRRVSETNQVVQMVGACPNVKASRIVKTDLGRGSCTLEIITDTSLFLKILSEKTQVEVPDESALLKLLVETNEIKRKFEKLESAYQDVMETGYGIVMPDISELSLEEPEIVRQSGKYGVRLKAEAPSIHMMRTTIRTEVVPSVGSEQQSEDLVVYLLKEFEENPAKIWESNIFGKTLHQLVNEGMHNKLHRMPEDARGKVRETIERIINDGCNGLVCIIL